MACDVIDVTAAPVGFRVLVDAGGTSVAWARVDEADELRPHLVKVIYEHSHRGVDRAQAHPLELPTASRPMTQSDGSVMQLTIDGREEASAIVVTRRLPFTVAQQEILRLIAERDVTPTEAGRITHLHRQPPCKRCQEGSCAYASSDGVDALKRLAERGLVRRAFAGVWTARRSRNRVKASRSRTSSAS